MQPRIVTADWSMLVPFPGLVQDTLFINANSSQVLQLLSATNSGTDIICEVALSWTHTLEGCVHTTINPLKRHSGTSMLHTGLAKFKTCLILQEPASATGYPELDSGAPATQLHFVFIQDRVINSWQIDKWYTKLRIYMNTAAFKELPRVLTSDQQTRHQKLLFKRQLLVWM